MLHGTIIIIIDLDSIASFNNELGGGGLYKPKQMNDNIPPVEGGDSQGVLTCSISKWLQSHLLRPSETIENIL